MNHWIIIPVVLPAIIAPVLAMATRFDIVLARACSVAATAALLFVSVGLMMSASEGGGEVYQLGNWVAPYGIVLVTGPTGSGKSTSLYAYLNTINSVDKRIITSEDPIEYEMAGINQVHMKPEIGLTFASTLRAILRQDPDVIMVGEIRDLETAEIAIKAAQTGHLVLSTLHTNDAPQTLTRLANMGVPPYNIASTINLIIAQRLARRLCNY